MQVYLVQCLYTDDKRIETKSILAVYKNVVSANQTVKRLRKTFKPCSVAIKAEYSFQVFDVHD